MAKTASHIYVAGYVQGVAFRFNAVRQARHLGVTGWVRNLPDGRVELLLEGEAPDVEHMTEWCRQGPRSAHVSQILIENRTYTGQFHDFDVVF